VGKDSGISQLALDLDTQIFVGLQLMTISTSRKFTRTELSPEVGFFRFVITGPVTVSARLVRPTGRLVMR
jgi:hypothetical protein